MIRRSTLPSMFSMTSILSDTFAPPRIATNGRSGDSSAWPRYCSSCSISRPAAGRSTMMRDAFDRRVRAMRGAERVVDVARRPATPAPSRTPASFFSSSGWKRRFSSRTTPPPRCAPVDRVARRRRCSRSANATGAPSSSRQPIGDRPQAHLRVRPCLSAGRDGWRARRSRRARARTGSSAATPGCACRRRSRRPSAGR